ncbi:MAG: FkbM family methyltransferase [Verrucomicrobiales bacterium]|nr:FkbM family methyltransferase [Verrucomicrobiales bacterium]
MATVSSPQPIPDPKRPAEDGPPPAPEESAFVRGLRHAYRSYRNGPLRPGHSALRHVLRRTLGSRYRVTLRSGLRLELDLTQGIQSTIFWYDGDVEPQLSWALREFLPLGGWMIDCGANCGLFGLEARLYRKANVLFVEPHPTLAAQVRRNVELNGWTESCRVLEAAASDHEGHADLHLCATNDGSHSLDADWPILGGPSGSRVRVPLVTLGRVIDERVGAGRVDFMKIDTEGHDLSVLRGLGDRLDPDRLTLMYLELGKHRREASELLHSRGYSGFLYRRDLLDGVALRRALRRAADGTPPCLFTPFDGASGDGESLWCGMGSPAERRLLEIARTGRENPS